MSLIAKSDGCPDFHDDLTLALAFDPLIFDRSRSLTLFG